MRRRRSAALLAAVLACAGAGCRHAQVPAAPLPSDWRSLAVPPAPFAALYRLSCCGQSNLILAVRSAADKMSMSVAVPPGGAAVAIWFEGDRGWVERVRERCREPLHQGSIPLPRAASLPLDPELAARLLSGLLPEEAREAPATPGWVEALDGRVTWRARIEGPPARCTRVLAFRRGEERPMFEAELGSHLGHVPERLLLTAGSQAAEMVLAEWHTSGPLQPPAWVAYPECGAAQ